MTPLVIVGSGGHGRELFDTITRINERQPTWAVKGFVDDSPTNTERLDRLGLSVLGDVDWLMAHPSTYALGIGTSDVRRSISERLDSVGMTPATIVHPRAHIGVDVRLGDGVVIYDRSTVTTNVSIGRHTHLNVGCAVQHDSEVGDFVQFSPGVFVNGDCRIGDGVFLGTGAIITRGNIIGTDARVGAGAVVLADVAARSTVVGVPAKPVGQPH